GLIKNCIVTTKENSTANTVEEKIVCDADSFYMGSQDFADYNKLRRMESALIKDTEIDKLDWAKSTIHLFEAHQYYTDYAKEHFEFNKIENLRKLKKKVSSQEVPANNV